jgi:hypothetical protein
MGQKNRKLIKKYMRAVAAQSPVKLNKKQMARVWDSMSHEERKKAAHEFKRVIDQ